jgi:prevent-host-death family protein
MRTVNITEFKAHCLRLIDEVGRTKEPIEITKRGRRIVVVAPAAETKEIDWTPGAFRDSITEVGDICVEGAELGVHWEALD